ncbi:MULTISPECIES: hypothetical protein [unclassified Cupriavidus]|uniref:hypothetical protein n=1 Tax=unclassified Cupriavidus TaxID=2640874 RepID=UPI0010F6E619|nr:MULTISPECIES: hypothetical protein [unclassified Cupriavidus]MWL86476.1 hypothetical protein [Cupriavidus sp. SW-Y-13]
MKDAPAFLYSCRTFVASGSAVAAALVLAGCATSHASRFDVDAFLRGSDTALPEVLANSDFLQATRIAPTECAALLQSPDRGALEDLPAASLARGPAWVFHPKGTPDKVWLIVGQTGGERSCHGPLPADAVKTLTERARG